MQCLWLNSRNFDSLHEKMKRRKKTGEKANGFKLITGCYTRKWKNKCVREREKDESDARHPGRFEWWDWKKNDDEEKVSLLPFSPYYSCSYSFADTFDATRTLDCYNVRILYVVWTSMQERVLLVLICHRTFPERQWKIQYRCWGCMVNKRTRYIYIFMCIAIIGSWNKW